MSIPEAADPQINRVIVCIERTDGALEHLVVHGADAIRMRRPRPRWFRRPLRLTVTLINPGAATLEEPVEWARRAPALDDTSPDWREHVADVLRVGSQGRHAA